MKKLINLIEECNNMIYTEKDFHNEADLVYNYFIDTEMFTYEELNLVTNINGYNLETLNDCLFSRFGYRDLEQMLSEWLQYYQPH